MIDDAWIVAAGRSDGGAPRLAKAIQTPDIITPASWYPGHYKLFEHKVDADREAAEANRLADHSTGLYIPYRVLVLVLAPKKRAQEGGV